MSDASTQWVLSHERGHLGVEPPRGLHLESALGVGMAGLWEALHLRPFQAPHTAQRRPKARSDKLRGLPFLQQAGFPTDQKQAAFREAPSWMSRPGLTRVKARRQDSAQ